jgi:hypothetical protein
MIRGRARTGRGGRVGSSSSSRGGVNLVGGRRELFISFWEEMSTGRVGIGNGI